MSAEPHERCNRRTHLGHNWESIASVMSVDRDAGMLRWELS